MQRIYSVGEKITLKKVHPCGGFTWTVIRTGADIKIQCDTCGRICMVTPTKLNKMEKIK